MLLPQLLLWLLFANKLTNVPALGSSLGTALAEELCGYCDLEEPVQTLVR